MKIVKSLEGLRPQAHTAVTIGTFDGVHRGHERIVQATVNAAKHFDGHSVVITFEPHPQHVLRPEQPLGLITTSDEKAALLERLGLDSLVVLPFNEKLAATSPEDFVKKILVDTLQGRHLIVGFNHAFGSKRQGHEDNLRILGTQYGFDVSVIAPVLCSHEPVSSTRIRKALLAGDVRCAAEMLQRPYSLSGKVVSGDAIGEGMGFPTANVQTENSMKLIPADGVYAVRIEHNNTLYGGMAHIGTRPTVDGRDRRLEAHLFDFSGDLYDQEIRVQFIGRIREEKRFNSIEVLRAQLKRDQISSLGLLNKTQF